MPGVQAIDLSHTLITDAGVVHLAKLPGLSKLNLTGTRVTAEGIAKFRQVSNGARVDSLE